MSKQLVYSVEEEELFFNKIDEIFNLSSSAEIEKAEALLLDLESDFPDPKEHCSVGDILMETIFSFYEQNGNLEKALPFYLKETAYLAEKMHHESILNPQHFLKTGIIYYRLNQLDKARAYFKNAFDLAGEELFEDLENHYLTMARLTDAEFESFKEGFIPNSGDQEEPTLSEDQLQLIDEYARKAEMEMDKNNFLVAIDWFKKAMDVLPDPKWDWGASGWLLASIGDAYFYSEKYPAALAALLEAAHVYGEDEPNSFVLLRIGQTYFEMEDQNNALIYLSKAHVLAGDDLFEDDQKYLKFFKKNRKL